MGQVSSNLLSGDAMHRSPSELIASAQNLNHQLRAWKESLPASIRPADQLQRVRLPSNLRSPIVILLHCAYYGGLMGIHNMFAIPWNNGLFEGSREGSETDATTNTWRDVCSNTVAESARNIIIMAKELECDGLSTEGCVTSSSSL